MFLADVIYFTCHELSGTILYFSKDHGRTWLWAPGESRLLGFGDGDDHGAGKDGTYVKGTNECSLAPIPADELSHLGVRSELSHLGVRSRQPELLLMNCRTWEHKRRQVIWDVAGVGRVLDQQSDVVPLDSQQERIANAANATLVAPNTTHTTTLTNITFPKKVADFYPAGLIDPKD